MKMRMGILMLVALFLSVSNSFAEEMKAEQEVATEARSVDNKICPVCGPEEGMIGKDDIAYEHEGKTYYFCSQDCLTAFKENPGKFTQKMDEAINKESQKDSGHKGHSDHKDHDDHNHK